ncbi:MAG: tetratricopeptide repeat protein [Thermoanaerobaculia bacterium]
MYKIGLLMICLGMGSAAVAQTASTENAVLEDPAVAGDGSATGTRASRHEDDPYAAYLDGDYETALAGFVDQQVERPDHLGIALNVGSAYYEMKNYAAAEKAFSAAAFSAGTERQAEAFYNLGNTAFRQGKLEQAVEFYRASLEKNPDDADAKFNVEFVRDEIRRRHEEAQKRQDQQSRQQDGDKSSDQEKADSDSQEGQSQQSASEEDGDGDGLSDSIEMQGENPTDPMNPDTDGDGVKDGDEDRNANGRVDPGETDPNKVDSDGDGVPDSLDQSRSEANAKGETAEDLQNGAGLTPQAAERYLQALQEGRPHQRHRGKRGQRRPAKDW